MYSIITEQNFRSEVLKSPLPTLLEFRADWSGACHILAPVIENLSAEYKGRVKIGVIDVDQYQNIAQQYGVREIPTFLFFKRGAVIHQMTGAISKRRLEERIKLLLE